MRKTILFFLFLTSSWNLYAQEITAMQNRIYGGDSLEIRRMDFSGFDLDGKDKTWNLKGVKLYKKRLRSRYIEKKDTLLSIGLLNRVLYQQSRGGQSIVSIEDKLMQIDYKEAEEYLRFPMKQGDSIAGQFSGKGLYCGQVPVYRYGTYVTKADSVGKIILPSGKEIYGVARVHTERLINLDYGNKTAERTKMQENVYRWFADGYRYPILEAIITTKSEKVMEQLLFYCNPEDQERLASNDVNKVVRDAVAKVGESSRNEKNTKNDDGFRYEISQNGQGISIHYQTEKPVKIVAMLASNQGYVYQHIERNDGADTGEIDISTNGLRRGQYVVYLNANGKNHAEKISVR